MTNRQRKVTGPIDYIEVVDRLATATLCIGTMQARAVAHMRDRPLNNIRRRLQERQLRQEFRMLNTTIASLSALIPETKEI